MEQAVQSSSRNKTRSKSNRSSQDSNVTTAYNRGVRDSTMRLRELAKQDPMPHSSLEESINDGFLPGISHGSQPSRASPYPPNETRSRSRDKFRPSLSRSRSAYEEPVSPSPEPQARPRHNTINEIPESPERKKSETGASISKNYQSARSSGSHSQRTTQNASDSRRRLPVTDPSVPQDSRRYNSTGFKASQSYSDVMLPHATYIAHLMNRTRGQMQGILYYRQDSELHWTRAYCFLSAASGSLFREHKSGSSANSKLAGDLRGCKVQAYCDPVSRERTLHVTTTSQPSTYHFRPADASEFHAWFAAFVCWQAVRRAKNLELELSDSQLTPVSISARRERRRSREDKETVRESTIIKVAKLAMWNQKDAAEPIPREARTTSDPKKTSDPPSSWDKVSCMLHEGGEFRVMNAADVRELVMIPLSKLPRSAVQRLCPSVLKCENVIAIFPQYTADLQSEFPLQPIYLRCESRPQHELWFVLLRAFTVPELYGPRRSKEADSLRAHEALPGLAQGSISSLFRVERTLHLHVGEFRTRALTRQVREEDEETGVIIPEPPVDASSEYFVQVLIDGIIRAKTRSRASAGTVAWFENLEIPELPPTASFITIQVRQLKPTSSSRHNSTQTSGPSMNTTTKSLDDQALINEAVAEMIFPLKSIGVDADKRWPLIDEQGRLSKNLSLKARLDRNIVLADQEYSVLSGLLHNFSSLLTLQLADLVPGDLSRLSVCLLNVFQVSGSAKDWLTSLAEEEIDGIRRQIRPHKVYYNSRLDSNDSREYIAAHEREELTRDMTRATIAEANLLFRGNTLLSKSLDSHMQRLGREYLEDTLGAKLREIAELDQDVEVDPSRLSATASLHFNWLRLHDLVRSVWSLIRKSAPKCPPELRSIFRHIKACAEEKYAHCLKTVPYSSVSGFLFLRFFCPAILNPALFDLVNAPPRPRAIRGFVLIAKTLQGLANQSTFGSKEPWMEPMNHFLNKHKIDFRDFIDELCIFAPIGPPSASSQYYSAALSTFSRLPTICKEGYLSLPFLIDETRGFASLVDMWLENIDYQPSNQPLDSELLQFHNECLNLRKKTLDLFRRAERGAQRSAALQETWNALVQQMQTTPEEFWIGFSAPSDLAKVDIDHNMLVQPEKDGEPKESISEQKNNRVGFSASTVALGTSEKGEIPRRGRHSDATQSQARSRTTSPLKTGEYDSAASGSQEDLAALPEAARKKKLSKDKQRHGLFGRRKKSDKLEK